MKSPQPASGSVEVLAYVYSDAGSLVGKSNRCLLGRAGVSDITADRRRRNRLGELSVLRSIEVLLVAVWIASFRVVRELSLFIISIGQGCSIWTGGVDGLLSNGKSGVIS